MKYVDKMILMILLVFVAGMPVVAQTEDEKAEVVYSNDGKGWVFGLNVGVYYPSKKTAAFYNGEASNVNNVNYVLYSTDTWFNQIFEALNANDSIAVYGLPQNMHYKLAIQPGLYAQYCFNPTFSLVIEFNYMRLKANDVIVFEVDPPIEYLGNPDLRLYPIRGVEERVYADIGLKRTFPKTDQVAYFAMGGLNVNSTKVIKNSFYVEEVEYNMKRIYNSPYIPNSNMQSFNEYQGGIGVGMFIGGGASLTFGNGIVFEPGIKAHWLMVKLDGYKDMNPGIGTYVRFLF